MAGYWPTFFRVLMDEIKFRSAKIAKTNEEISRPVPIVLSNVWANFGFWSNILRFKQPRAFFCLSEQFLSKI